jgi:hypothetical protein
MEEESPVRPDRPWCLVEDGADKPVAPLEEYAELCTGRLEYAERLEDL